MHPTLLIGAGLAALMAIAAPARAAGPQPCENPNLPAAVAPCPQAPCLWTPKLQPCDN